MNLSTWLRQAHRWLSIAFTAAFLINAVAWSRGTPPAWLPFLAVVPLILLLVSGLYLFALPYLARGRS